MKRLAILAALTLASCGQQPAGEPVVRTELAEAVEVAETVPQQTEAPAKSNPDAVCQPVSFEEVALTHCIADPELHTIRTSLAPSSGANFGTIEGWAAGKNESAIAFVTNAGIFGDDLKPIGYFVEEADRLEQLNRSDGDGNFFLKPNGVFFGTAGKWQIIDTDTFLRTIGTRPQFGTQSGPMLVIDGNLHPQIQDDGPSQTIRNAVGLDNDGNAHFVISDEPLSFGKLARFFRDELKTPNALLLDAGNSALWHPASGRMDAGRVGPLIVVETK